MQKSIVILDIKKKIGSKNDNIFNILKSSDKILSLTPYSCFLLNNINQNYSTFHDLISVDEFKKINLSVYDLLVDKLWKYRDFFYLLIKIMPMVTKKRYLLTINNYIDFIYEDGYRVIYITDKVSFINKHIDKVILVNNQDQLFYFKSKSKNFYINLKYKQNLFNSFKNKFFKWNISYDAIHYINNFKPYKINFIFNNDIEVFLKKLKNELVKINFNDKDYNSFYKSITNNYSKILIELKDKKIKYKPFTFISNDRDFILTKVIKNNNRDVVFFQHGSYLYSGEFTEWCEVKPATINFVCNDFTKKLFLSRDATKVYSVGSVNFNLPIKNRKIKYDYLYITHCNHYSLNGLYTNKMDRTNMDANEIYLRHSSIIKLFGTKFKDKKICIKIQRGIFTGTMMYVPFLELSKEYKNITIEFIVPISRLIEESKYIISDYFSSEFINRELHYKRDIILFQNLPIVFPKETMDDMTKMFILVETMDDLEEKIKNIEVLTKDRKRYDDIIEYYSSKKCDTKKVVTQILEKELNGR